MMRSNGNPAAATRLGQGLLAATAVVVLLAGCSAGASSNSSIASPLAAAQGKEGAATGTFSSTNGTDAAGGAPVAGSPGLSAQSAGSAPGTVIPALLDRSIIRTATVEVRVKDVLGSAARAETLAAGAGGYVAGEQTQADPAHPEGATAVITLRVPSAALSSLLSSLTGLGVLVAQDQSSSDVTGQVIDVQARLQSQQASVDRIRALLAQAKTIGQVVEIEGELANREGALESLQGQAKQLADQTSLATVTATLVGPQATAPVKPVQKSGFGHGLSQGWNAFTTAATWVLTALGAVLPFLLILVPLVWAAALLRRRRTPAVVVHPEPVTE
jgi:hypothetical protein